MWLINFHSLSIGFPYRLTKYDLILLVRDGYFVIMLCQLIMMMGCTLVVVLVIIVNKHIFLDEALSRIMSIFCVCDSK